MLWNIEREKILKLNNIKEIIIRYFLYILVFFGSKVFVMLLVNNVNNVVIMIIDV